MIKLFIDCHAHLFFRPIPKEAITEDITGVIPSPTKEFRNKMILTAKEKGVGHIVGVISDPKDFPSYQKQLALENITHVIGISRNNASENNSQMISLLRKEIERKVPHAIGEIGLDYSYGFDNTSEQKKNALKKNQQELFRKQIRLALEINIPIVVHAGYGDDRDILKIIKQERAQEIGGQIHGYMSQKEVVSELLELGFYFSFGYSHLTNTEFRKIITITPLEQILTETDSPYHLIDSPQRFILPEDVVLISNELASLKEVEIEVFAHQVMSNAQELFRF